MEFIKISMEDLSSLLNLAFVEGYTSYLDLQESAVQTILNDYLKKDKLDKRKIIPKPPSDEEEDWLELK